MSVIGPVLCSLLSMYIGYRFYSKYLAEKVFRLDDSKPTPAITMQDGVDYVPTPKPILMSHHFASIAGLSPIVGPAIAAIWGWLPAMIWLVVGAVLMGAVHDMTALVISMRNRGRSIGDVCESLIGKRARILFLVMIYVALALAMGAFTAIVANLIQMPSESVGHPTYPEASLPAVLLMVLAMILGLGMRYRSLGIIPVSVIGLSLTFVFIWLGSMFPIYFTLNTWAILLLLYALAASILPVWLLLQPRDYINTLSLYFGLIVLYMAVFLFMPSFTAPAINSSEGLPSIFPLMFVTVACGAVSGFHSVVASGTTAKQIAKESDARPIGYGSMIAECGLGLIAVLACTAGISSLEAWQAHYGSWNTGGLFGSISFFVSGAATFISWLGIPMEIASTFVALLIVSFALTTLDSGTRLLRYNIEEISDALNIPVIRNRYISSTLAVTTIGFFALSDFGKSVWILFGTVNQLLAALGLLVGTVYLLRLRRNIWVTAIPMVFMLITTVTAMTMNMQKYITDGEVVLILVGGFISALVVGLVIEAILFFTRWRGSEEAIAGEGDSAPV